MILLIKKSKDYDNDIDFDLSYINIETHITMVYEDLEKKYKNLKNYKIIPVGWSLGGYMALYFSQKYTSNCIHCILLDPSSLIQTKKSRLEDFTTNIKKLKTRFKKDDKISNIKYKKILKLMKTGDYTTNELYYIYYISVYLRQLYALKLINFKFPIPTTSFINYDEKRQSQNSKRKKEIKILKNKIQKITYPLFL